MPNKPPLSDTTKGMLLALHNEGHSNSEIGRRLHIDEGSVRYNLGKLRDHGTMEVHLRSGRPKKKHDTMH